MVLMQRLRSIYWMFGIVLLALQACNTAVPSGEGAAQEAPPERHCGFSQLFEVRTEDGRAIGAFELKNDEKDLWIIYFPAGGFQAEEISVYWGEKDALPRDGEGNPDLEKFQIRKAKPDEAGSWFSTLTSKTAGACGMMSAHVIANKDGETFSGWVTSGNLGNQKKGVEYCRQTCANLALGCSISDTTQPPLTVTPAQWVSDDAAAGGHATMLRKYFQRAFPEGVSLGCEHKCIFSSAEAVMAFLPLSGPAESLMKNLENPSGQAEGNVLLSELLALKMTLAYDKEFPTFSQAPMQLAGLEVADGAFKGWSVTELSMEAETILGGCASNYSPQQISQVIIEVNASFSQKGVRGTYLTCPSGN